MVVQGIEFLVSTILVIVGSLIFSHAYEGFRKSYWAIRVVTIGLCYALFFATTNMVDAIFTIRGPRIGSELLWCLIASFGVAGIVTIGLLFVAFFQHFWSSKQNIDTYYFPRITRLSLDGTTRDEITGRLVACAALLIGLFFHIRLAIFETFLDIFPINGGRVVMSCIILWVGVWLGNLITDQSNRFNWMALIIFFLVTGTVFFTGHQYVRE